MIPEIELRDGRAALELLDRIALRAGDRFDTEEYDRVYGARKLLQDWLAGEEATDA